MLDPWIIEQIKRREIERRKEGEAQRIQIPLERQIEESAEPPTPSPSDRGVVVIDM